VDSNGPESSSSSRCAIPIVRPGDPQFCSSIPVSPLNPSFASRPQSRRQLVGSECGHGLAMSRCDAIVRPSVARIDRSPDG
jgi:hypothetical protein